MQPTEAAQTIGVTPSTIRRWLAWHAAHLSADANPAPGGRRKLNGRDIEVLREVKRLRDEGLTTDQVNGRLGNIAIPDLPAPDDTEAHQNAPDAPGEQIERITGNDALASLQTVLDSLAELPALRARVETLEAQRPTWRDVIILCLASLTIGLIVGLSIWWFQ
jgi:DNA-binding transcriptional MerR regulator